MSKPSDFSLLSQKASAKGAKLLVPITVHGLAQLKKQETPENRAWIAQNNFTGRPGETLPILDEKRDVVGYYFGLSKDKGLYSLAGVSSKLPSGRYTVHAMDSHFTAEEAHQAVLGWALQAYKFDRYKSTKAPKKAQLIIPSHLDEKALLSEVSSVYMVRDLINRTANDLGPKTLAKEVKNLAKEFNCVAKVLKNKKDIPFTHTVGRAASEAPRMVDFSWGDEQAPKVTLVGKGITFDSGGLNVKTGASMFSMKKDMGGAAHALGLAKMIMEANLPVRLRVLIPIAENAISEEAYHPGDILTSKENAKGKTVTVEVGNTDAEGRLILTDALIEASKEKPDLLIDFATLTGAQRVAHGAEIGAIIGTDKEMLRMLEDIGENIDDYLGILPLHERYRSDLSSQDADISSTGGQAGAITAALYLRTFVDAAKWVHFDVSASNARSSAARPKGGEAMGVRTMFRYIDKKFG